MENSYGIGVTNRYELFYDDNVDPLDFLINSERKKDKTAEKENKVSEKKTKSTLPVKKAPKNDTIIKNSDKSEPIKPKSKTIRNNDTRVKFSDREERNNRQNRPEVDIKENRESSTTQRFDGESRGRGGLPSRGTYNRGGGGGGRGGRRGSRGSGGPPGGDYRGKREFDRQSGMVTSGVKPVDKRDGSGSYNWGSDKDQITQEQTNHTTTSNTTTTNDLDTSVAAENEKPATTEEIVNGEEEAAKEEESQKEMTLDEWRASQKREKPVFKTRRAGEGENTNQWKKTYVLKKKIIEESSDEEEDDTEEEEEVQHGRKKVLVLPIDFQFSDTHSRGRGGRGRGRGGGGPGRGRGGASGTGRGGGRGRFQGPHRQEAPKMDDERDFPSLG